MWKLTPTMTARLDSDGVLTVGTTQVSEAMPDYSSFYDIPGYVVPARVHYYDVPWYDVRSQIRSVVIEDNVASVGNSAFCDPDGGYSKLTSVTMGRSVKSIGDNAFEGCKFLTSIAIPNSTTFIGYCAFKGCAALSSITIPHSVKYIEYRAFWNCLHLKHVTVAWATPLPLSIDIFEGVNTSKLTLHVPAGTKALYRAAEVWKDFGTILDGAK